MLTCFDVADYFLSLVNEEMDGRISNLKLQKLLYYAQGFHLAIYNKRLFDSTIQAWDHGPVVPEVYQKYKKYGAKGIPSPKAIDYDKYDDTTKEFLDEIYDVFGQFSAWKLRNMTHTEPPWKNASGVNGTISDKSMKEYFKTRLK